MYIYNNGYGDFGRSWLTPLKTVLQRTVKVVSLPITATRKLVHGDVKGSVKTFATTLNPVQMVASVVTDNPRILDYAKIASPATVMNIDNKKLRKQAAIGYAAAAVVAAAVFVGPSAAGAMKFVGDAQKGISLATTAAGMMNRKKGEEGGEEYPQETAPMGFPEQRTETEIKHMSPAVKYSLIAAGSLATIGTIAYFVMRKRP